MLHTMIILGQICDILWLSAISLPRMGICRHLLQRWWRRSIYELSSQSFWYDSQPGWLGLDIETPCCLMMFKFSQPQAVAHENKKRKLTADIMSQEKASAKNWNRCANQIVFWVYPDWCDRLNSGSFLKDRFKPSFNCCSELIHCSLSSSSGKNTRGTGSFLVVILQWVLKLRWTFDSLAGPRATLGKRSRMTEGAAGGECLYRFQITCCEQSLLFYFL